jgi:hypothetical protein
MAGFNVRDPRFQRDIQRAQSKASMSGGGPAKVGGVVGAHAQNQLGRQIQFGRLALESKLADQQFGMAKEVLDQRHQSYQRNKDRFSHSKDMFGRRYDSEQENMNWQVGLGIGGLGISYLEGNRREGILKEDKARRTTQDKLISDMIQEKSNSRTQGLNPVYNEDPIVQSLGRKKTGAQTAASTFIRRF